jgi:FAD/FMN-containing dehydrogenase
MFKIPDTRRSFIKTMGALGLGSALPDLNAAGTVTDPQSELPLLLDGKVILRSDENYEIWRQSMIWHLSKPKRYPDLIVQAHSDADVVEAVRYARRNGLKVALRCGGHSSCGTSVREGGMLIDLARLRSVEIDKQKGIAAVGPAITSFDFANVLAEQGLAFPVAHCGTVPMGGYLLGGGMGWNGESWGDMGCFSIVAADVVTAQGELINVNAEQYSEIFWALRGAGPGFFGAVTKFYLRVYPLPAAMTANTYFHSLEQLPEVVGTLQAYMDKGPRNVDAFFFLQHDEDADPSTRGANSKLCRTHVTAFADSKAEAGNLLKPINDSVLAKTARSKSEGSEISFRGLLAPDRVASGMSRFATDSILTESLNDAVATVAEHFAGIHSPESHILVAIKGSARLPEDAAFSKNAKGYISYNFEWQDKAQDAAHHQWLAESFETMQPFGSGYYINEMDYASDPVRVRQAFAPSNWERLRRLRKKFDPSGVFHDYLGLTEQASG